MGRKGCMQRGLATELSTGFGGNVAGCGHGVPLRARNDGQGGLWQGAGMVETTDGIDIIKGQLKGLPGGPGVYRMLNAKGDVLYVGKAKSLKSRVASYTQPERMPGRIRKMVFETRELVVVETRTEVEALLLEANLIKSLRPRYNILFKDDASYVSVLITDEPTPMIRSFRGARKAKGHYFGPYPSAIAVYQTLDLMERAFRLRTCGDAVFRNRTRPCLKYDIKRCSGPCVGKVSPEAYNATVKQAIRFLNGERGEVLAALQGQMAERAERMDYEGAAALRDRIRALSAVSSASTAMTHAMDEADVFALVREPGPGGEAVAVQAFYYRHGQHVGNQFFPVREGEGAPDGEVMRLFLAQHYTGRACPPKIVLNVAVEEPGMLEEALGLAAGRKVGIEVPSRGDKVTILRQAELNARQTLRRRTAEAEGWREQMAELAGVLGLAREIAVVECYDISNTSGKNAVASLVAAGPEGLLKKQYRRYAIKTKDTPDDYAMLREVLERRVRRGRDEEQGKWALPDVFLIDGGKGQLGVLVEVMREAGLLEGPDCPALCSIAKGEERDKGLEVIWQARWVDSDGAGGAVHVGELPIYYGTPLIFMLQRIRDEAHRFAITFHRAKRAKALTASALDDIPGIGPSKKKALLLHFGSRDAIAGAAVEELVRVKGINRTLAETVYGFFHG